MDVIDAMQLYIDKVKELSEIYEVRPEKEPESDKDGAPAGSEAPTETTK